MAGRDVMHLSGCQDVSLEVIQDKIHNTTLTYNKSLFQRFSIKTKNSNIINGHLKWSAFVWPQKWQVQNFLIFKKRNLQYKTMQKPTITM